MSNVYATFAYFLQVLTSSNFKLKIGTLVIPVYLVEPAHQFWILCSFLLLSQKRARAKRTSGRTCKTRNAAY